MRFSPKALIVTLCIFLCPIIAHSQEELTWKELKDLKDNQVPKALEQKLKKEVKVRGFMMPLDYSSKEISEFLLMPYIPTCMHVPTPPANQIILVKMKEGQEVPASFYPVELKGVVSVSESKEFESSYEMIGHSLKEIDEDYDSGMDVPGHEYLEEAP